MWELPEGTQNWHELENYRQAVENERLTQTFVALLPSDTSSDMPNYFEVLTPQPCS